MSAVPDTDDQIHATIAKLMAETGKLSAETAKISAETSKINRETKFYPVVIAISLFAGGSAFTIVVGALLRFMGVGATP